MKMHHFRSKRKTVINIGFWARFWSPKRPKSLFSLLGQLFGSGAFWVPKALQKRKMMSFSLFCSQKWKIAFLRFWSKKGPQNVVFIKGFALLAKVSKNHFFHFFIRFHVFMLRKEELFNNFFFSEQQHFHKNSSFSPRAPNSGKHKHLGTFLEPGTAQNRFRFICAETAKSAQTRFGCKSVEFCKKLCFWLLSK